MTLVSYSNFISNAMREFLQHSLREGISRDAIIHSYTLNILGVYHFQDQHVPFEFAPKVELLDGSFPKWPIPLDNEEFAYALKERLKEFVQKTPLQERAVQQLDKAKTKKNLVAFASEYRVELYNLSEQYKKAIPETLANSLNSWFKMQPPNIAFSIAKITFTVKYMPRTEEKSIEDTFNLHSLISCDTCNNIQCTALMLLSCNGCSTAKYCSRDCQKTNWKEHRKFCHFRPAEKDAPAVEIEKASTSQEIAVGKKSCTNCNTMETTAQCMDKCRGCLIVPYCSLECQEEDWLEHRKICLVIQSYRNKSEECIACGFDTPLVDKCSGCFFASYCSESCQHEDWKNHRKICKIIQAAKK